MVKLDAGDIAGAISDLEAFRSSAEAPAAVVGILGGLYAEAGDATRALELLRPLADDPSANPAVLYNAGRAAIGLGDREAAFEYLARAVEMAPGSPADRELGLLLGSVGQFGEAYTLLKPWSDAHPNDGAARLAAAMGAVQLDRVPEAEALLSELDAENPGVRLLWGQLLQTKGDPWGSIGYLQPMLGEVPPLLEADVRRLLAKAYLQVGESSEAIAVLDGHVGENPALGLQLSRALHQSGELDQALETLEPFAQNAIDRASEGGIDPGILASLTLDYGTLLNTAGRHDEALPFLRLTTELDERSKLGWQNLGQALAAAGQTDEAKAALERFQELSKEEENAPLDQAERDIGDPTGKSLREAMALLSRDRGEEALRLIRREAELAPQDIRPRLMESRALVLLERPDEAAQIAQAVVAAAPNNADAHFVFGSALIALRDEGAEAALRKALELAPEHTGAMNDLAVLLISAKRTDEARDLLQRVLDLRPDDPLALSNLERLQKAP